MPSSLTDGSWNTIININKYWHREDTLWPVMRYSPKISEHCCSSLGYRVCNLLNPSVWTPRWSADGENKVAVDETQTPMLWQSPVTSWKNTIHRKMPHGWCARLSESQLSANAPEAARLALWLHPEADVSSLLQKPDSFANLLVVNSFRNVVITAPGSTARPPVEIEPQGSAVCAGVGHRGYRKQSAHRACRDGRPHLRAHSPFQ